MRKLIVSLMFLIMTLFLTSCSLISEIIEIVSVEEEDPLDIYEDEPRRQDVRDYTFYRIRGLIPLENGHYEGWIYQENAFISTGKFNINPFKTTVKSSGPDVDVGRVTDLKGDTIMDGRFESKEAFNHPEKVYITVESEEDADSIPGTFLLAGDIEKRRSALAFRAISTKDVAGTFKVGNCATGNCRTGTSGAWFFRDSIDKDKKPVKVTSLKLPVAPKGTSYEAWLRIKTDKEPLFISLGKFTSPSGTDHSNAVSGGRSGVPFPGDDVLVLPAEVEGLKAPIDLASGEYTLLITLQPFAGGVDQTPDLPFPLWLLEAEIPKGTAPGSDIKLHLPREPLPTADLVIR